VTATAVAIVVIVTTKDATTINMAVTTVAAINGVTTVVGAVGKACLGH